MHSTLQLAKFRFFFVRFFSYVLLVCVLSAIAGFRGEINDLDAGAYLAWYSNLEGLSVESFVGRVQDLGLFYGDGVNKFEVGFAALGFLFEKLGASFAQFLLFCAAFSISVKLGCLFRYIKGTAPLLACVAWYFSWQFLLMEMNALRVGFALSIAMLGFEHLVRRSWRFLPYVIAGSLFHVSIILLALLIPVDRLKFLRKRSFVYLLILSALLGYMPFHEFAYWALGNFSKISTYYSGIVNKEIFYDINRFNVISLFKLLVFFATLKVYRGSAEGSVSRLGVHSFFVSLCCYFALSSFPVLSGRLFELFGFFSVFSIAIFVQRIRPMAVSCFFIFIISFLQFYAIVYYSRLVNIFYFIDMPWLHVDLVSVPVMEL